MNHPSALPTIFSIHLDRTRVLYPEAMEAMAEVDTNVWMNLNFLVWIEGSTLGLRQAHHLWWNMADLSLSMGDVTWERSNDVKSTLHRLDDECLRISNRILAGGEKCDQVSGFFQLIPLLYFVMSILDLSVVWTQRLSQGRPNELILLTMYHWWHAWRSSWQLLRVNRQGSTKEDCGAAMRITGVNHTPMNSFGQKLARSSRYKCVVGQIQSRPWLKLSKERERQGKIVSGQDWLTRHQKINQVLVPMQQI